MRRRPQTRKDSSMSACSTSKWLISSAKVKPCAHKLWSRWFVEKKTSRKRCVPMSRPSSVNSNAWTWSDASTRRTSREFKFRLKWPALKKRKPSGSEGCRTLVRCKRPPLANSRWLSRATLTNSSRLCSASSEWLIHTPQFKSTNEKMMWGGCFTLHFFTYNPLEPLFIEKVWTKKNCFW